MPNTERDICLDELIALLEGELDGSASAGVREHIAAGGMYRQEYDRLCGLYADLESLGDSQTATLPAVDFVDAVLAHVADAESTAPYPGQIVTFPVSHKPARQRLSWTVWAGTAAAAMLAVAVWLAYVPAPQDRMAHRPSAPERAATSHDDAESTATAPPSTAELLASLQQLSPEVAAHRPAQNNLAETEPVDLGSVTLADIIETRRAALSDETARARLAQWARLPQDKAKAIASDTGSSAEAVVGACASLSDGEAGQMLFQAVGRYPDNTAVKIALVKRLTSNSNSNPLTRPLTSSTNSNPLTRPLTSSTNSNPLTKPWTSSSNSSPLMSSGAALEQLQLLRAQDPGNSLWLYMQARILAERGDLQGVLAMLKEARGLDTASLDAGRSARATAEALTQGGTNPAVAKMLAAMTAGQDEYNLLCDLGRDLLQYGNRCADATNVDAATQIYEAIQQLGKQLTSSATYSEEKLAGLDLQQMALNEIQTLPGATETAAGAEKLTAEAQELRTQVEGFGQFLAAVDKLIFGTTDSSVLNLISEAILAGGDLGMFDYLNGAGASVSSSQ